jgi:hypothetical protein
VVQAGSTYGRSEDDCSPSISRTLSYITAVVQVSLGVQYKGFGIWDLGFGIWNCGVCHEGRLTNLNQGGNIETHFERILETPSANCPIVILRRCFMKLHSSTWLVTVTVTVPFGSFRGYRAGTVCALDRVQSRYGALVEYNGNEKYLRSFEERACLFTISTQAIGEGVSDHLVHIKDISPSQAAAEYWFRQRYLRIIPPKRSPISDHTVQFCLYTKDNNFTDH